LKRRNNPNRLSSNKPSDLMINKSYFLEGAKQCLSPNFSERQGGEVSLLVIHNISLPPGEFGSDNIEKLFTNQLSPEAHPYFEGISSLKVSSHLLINREGLITQFVPFNMAAWHAGVSSFQGLNDCNQFSIGIELEGTDDIDYTKEQYQSLIEVSKDIMLSFPKINKENIMGHSDIAPERKTDPGPSFDWHLYLSSLD
jgi:AmpD protein